MKSFNFNFIVQSIVFGVILLRVFATSSALHAMCRQCCDCDERKTFFECILRDFGFDFAHDRWISLAIYVLYCVFNIKHRFHAIAIACYRNLLFCPFDQWEYNEYVIIIMEKSPKTKRIEQRILCVCVRNMLDQIECDVNQLHNITCQRRLCLCYVDSLRRKMPHNYEIHEWASERVSKCTRARTLIFLCILYASLVLWN